ncbi:MAG: endonuclease/exonuclease/phosphatase family protein, partial [Planctomycetota bacterium]
MLLKSSCTAVIGLALLLLAPIASAQELVPAKQDGTLRIATYNVSLNRPEQGKLREDLEAGNQQAEALAAVIRAVKPDILLLNEVDYVAGKSNAEYFASQYISAIKKDALGGGAIRLPYVYDAPVNTGVPSGMDLNQNDKNTDPEDAWGYGRFPGQYGMAVLSRFEVDKPQVRTLQKFLWSDLPGALRPQAEGQPSYYDDVTWKKLRLSSKSLWDVPIKTRLGVIHVLASHPTPPAFDGPEDRNGCRNHDEILLIQKYIEGAEFLRGDDGERAGLSEGDSFVVMGDLNSDPA